MVLLGAHPRPRELIDGIVPGPPGLAASERSRAARYQEEVRAEAGKRRLGLDHARRPEDGITVVAVGPRAGQVREPEGHPFEADQFPGVQAGLGHFVAKLVGVVEVSRRRRSLGAGPMGIELLSCLLRRTARRGARSSLPSRGRCSRK